MRMIIGERIWWYWTMLVFALAYKVDECCSVCDRYSDESFATSFEYSLFKDHETTDQMREHVAVLWNEAREELKTVIMAEKSETPQIERHREARLQAVAQDLMLYGFRRQAVWCKHATVAGVHTLIYVAYDKRDDKEEIVNHADFLATEMMSHMAQDHEVWGIISFTEKVNEATDLITQVGFFITHSQIPLGLINLDSQAWKKGMKKLVMGQSHLETVNFNPTSRMEKKQLPAIFCHLLDDILNDHFLLQNSSRIAMFSTDDEEIGVEFIYDANSTTTVARIDVIGILKDIMISVFETMCNAILQNMNIPKHTASHASHQDFTPFAFFFDRFRIVVTTPKWQMSSDQEDKEGRQIYVEGDWTFPQHAWWNVHDNSF